MLFSNRDWDTLLRSNFFFSGRGWPSPDTVFWRENLRLFGTLNIVIILGLQQMATIDYGNFDSALENPIFINRVELALFHRRELDQASLSALPGVGGNSEHQQAEITIRLMLYDRWRSVLRDANIRRVYISAMNTAGVDGASIWDDGLLDDTAPVQRFRGPSSSQIQQGFEGGNNAATVSTSEANLRAGSSNSNVEDNVFAAVSGRILLATDSVEHDTIPCCAICRENDRDENFVHLPCCGRGTNTNNIHGHCLEECYTRDETPFSLMGLLSCPFCRELIHVPSILEELDTSDDEVIHRIITSRGAGSSSRTPNAVPPTGNENMPSTSASAMEPYQEPVQRQANRMRDGQGGNNEQIEDEDLISFD